MIRPLRRRHRVILPVLLLVLVAVAILVMQ